MANIDRLSGKSKAAILLVSMGPDLSAEVMKHLNEEEIEELTLEIANLNQVSSDVKDDVLDEFHQMCVAYDYLNQGGIDYAKEVLEKALGKSKAENVINRLTASLQVRPFEQLRKTDPAQLLNFIQNEHPQTIALIMAYLAPDQASSILSALSSEQQTEVAKRIAVMDRTSPEVIKEVERVLEQKLSSLMTDEYSTAGGLDSIVDILNLVDRGTEKTILEELDEDDPELAEDIKQRMFVFEDIVLLTDRAIQMVLREIDMEDLGLALKTVGDEVSEKIFSNLSNRAANMLKEDMEFMGPVRIRDVEEAQQRIVNEIRRLEEAGDIVIDRGGGDELVV
ncbi:MULTISPECIES: flagellar motor switch protein FliG [unclassified Candidatus Frackibacter]|nr:MULTISPECIES: flagellar motor switch protein FliG [unclassified Candidatus Frackibacter]KXS45243.1 MAG: flagellar motor switch protein FliG [Candidatus Frackibacter sp. T328-2]SDB99685.1 flagellar motor switch protein FliG [Candidatus Frackibacter sp. WG11]SFL36252.1 flagellar motor switch protein FliG [Candidatus Frackibacter sp. WG13]